MELERSLTAWVPLIQLNLLSLGRSIKSLGELSDGLALLQLMARMCGIARNPEFFDFGEVLEPDALHTRVNNLRRLLRGLENFYQEVIKVKLDDFGVSFDPLEFAKKSDKVQGLKLMEIVTGAILKCENSAVIAKIRDLPESQQNLLMQFIQRILLRLESSPVAQVDLSHYQNELTRLRTEVKGLSHDLASVNERVRELEKVNEELAGQVKVAEKPDLDTAKSPRSLDETTRLNALLKQKVEALGDAERLLLETRHKAKELETGLQDELHIANDRIKALETSANEAISARETIQELRAFKAKVKEEEAIQTTLGQKIEAQRIELKLIPELKAELQMAQDQLKEAQAREDLQSVTISDLQKTVDRLNSFIVTSPRSRPVTSFPSPEDILPRLQSAEQEIERLRQVLFQARSDASDSWGKYNGLVMELREMYQEKDALAQKYLVSKEEAMQLNSVLLGKEVIIKGLETQITELKEEKTRPVRGKSEVRVMELELETMKLEQELGRAKELLIERQKHIQVLEADSERLEATWRKTFSEAQLLHSASLSSLQERLDTESEQTRILTLLKDDMAQNWMREQQLMASALLNLGSQLQKVERHIVS